MRILFRGVAALLAAFGFLYGQAQVSSGDLTGSITDPSGGAVAQAKVTATEADRGVSRTAMTDPAGEYRIPLLPPGTYRVRVEAPNFTTKVIEGVVVRVGDSVVLRTSLEIGSISAEVSVTAEAPVVESERTQQATTIDSRRIENLPINRRNYLDFALLSPGVVETNDLVDGTDFRVVQTPQSGLSFGGGNGRGNAFMIDGVENHLNSGGVRPSVSQEAVREFQINRNSYTAEFGGAIGGAVNIITKSGTNDVHGDFFGFLRHRDIQARNYFDPAKSAFTRGQYGATFSVPIVRDKTFVFGAYERLDRHETAFVPILQDRSAFSSLTPSQEQLATYFESSPVPQFKALGAAMRQYLITDNFPRTLALFNENSGTFPFAEDNSQVSLRLDHQFSERNQSFVRGNFTLGTNENAQFGALIGFNRGRRIDTTDGSIVLSNTHIFNSRWITDTRFLFGYNKLDVVPTDHLGPDLTITGYGSFGREIFLPSTSYERHYQLQQNVNYVSGRHAVKFGADINPVYDVVRSETFFGGRFVFGEQVPLGSLLPILTRDPNATANIIAGLTSLGQQRLIPNLQAPITSLQAYNLGLPVLYQQGFGDPNWKAWFKRYGFFAQDAWKVRPNLMLTLGVRYQLEIPPKVINTDPNNVAPRVGFAWTLDQAAKTVVRGGFGLYYGTHTGQIANLPDTLNGVQIAQAAITPLGIPGLNNPRTGQPLTSFDVYQTLLLQGVIGSRTITQADIAQFGLRPGPNAPGRVVFGITPDFVNPYSEQASFEIERAVGDFALSAGYVFNRGAHIPRNLDRNLYYAGRTANDQPIFGFYNPAVLQYNVMESTANSVYHALTLQASKRFTHHTALNMHYTFSKAMDDTTDFNSDFEPHDQLNARAERALSSFDQRHRFVASGVLESPFTNRVLKDFIFSPIVTASSGRPFNLLTGYDNLNDHHPTTHRPFNAGRNIGQGPGYFTVDARLSRRFPLGKESRNLEFTAEGFNLLNRTNFKNINNTVGNARLEDLPRPIAGVRGNPTAPLSFTSAYDPRQFQFGLKLNF